MDEKTRKYMELLEELVKLVGEEKKTGRDDDIGLRITQMARELRQMSIAVHPAARAPNVAEQSETAHAGVGWPM